MVFFKKNVGLIIVLILSFFSILPLLQSGFFPMHDDTQVSRVFEMGKALSDGIFPVRWVADLGYGYGYPIFNFYAPFAYYLGGFLTFLIDPLLSTKIILIIALVLSGVSMYFFINSLLGKIEAIVSSVIYLYFPYHAVNTYIRGDLAELYAYVFLPIVFLGLFKLYFNFKKNQSLKHNLKWVLTIGVGTALVIISHNLTSFMLLLYIILFLIFVLIFSKHRSKLLTYYVLSLALGFLLSSFYSIPALLEIQYTNVQSQIGGGAHFADHFVCPSQVWDSYWGFGGSTKGCLDGMSFKMGKSNILFLVFSFLVFLYLLIKKKGLNKLLFLFTVFCLLFSMYMMFDISKILWQIIPFASFLQYPWRFLNFISLFSSITIALLIYNLRSLFSQKLVVISALFIIVLTLILNAKLFNPRFIYPRSLDYYTNKEQLKWTISKISDEYLPENFSKPKNLNETPNKPIDMIGLGSFQILEDKTGLLKARIKADRDSVLKLNLAYFPSWQVKLNDKNSNYSVGANGLYLKVPEGSSLVEVVFNETLIEKVANTLSLISLFIILLAIIRHYRLKYEK